jgi:hypothetical protein
MKENENRKAYDAFRFLQKTWWWILVGVMGFGWA